MKNKNIFVIVISAIILAFDISMSFIFNSYGVKIVAQDFNILYIIAKCIAIIAFIGIAIFVFFRKDSASYIIQYVATIILQFVPLITRYLSLINNGFILSLIIFFVTLIIYFGLIFGLFVLGNMSAKAAKNLEGKKISVKDDKKYE